MDNFEKKVETELSNTVERKIGSTALLIVLVPVSLYAIISGTFRTAADDFIKEYSSPDATPEDLQNLSLFFSVHYLFILPILTVLIFYSASQGQRFGREIGPDEHIGKLEKLIKYKTPQVLFSESVSLIFVSIIMNSFVSEEVGNLIPILKDLRELKDLAELDEEVLTNTPIFYLLQHGNAQIPTYMLTDTSTRLHIVGGMVTPINYTEEENASYTIIENLPDTLDAQNSIEAILPINESVENITIPIGVEMNSPENPEEITGYNEITTLKLYSVDPEGTPIDIPSSAYELRKYDNGAYRLVIKEGIYFELGVIVRYTMVRSDHVDIQSTSERVNHAPHSLSFGPLEIDNTTLNADMYVREMMELIRHLTKYGINFSDLRAEALEEFVKKTLEMDFFEGELFCQSANDLAFLVNEAVTAGSLVINGEPVDQSRSNSPFEIVLGFANRFEKGVVSSIEEHLFLQEISDSGINLRDFTPNIIENPKLIEIFTQMQQSSSDSSITDILNKIEQEVKANKDLHHYLLQLRLIFHEHSNEITNKLTTTFSLIVLSLLLIRYKNPIKGFLFLRIGLSMLNKFAGIFKFISFIMGGRAQLEALKRDPDPTHLRNMQWLYSELCKVQFQEYEGSKVDTMNYTNYPHDEELSWNNILWSLSHVPFNERTYKHVKEKIKSSRDPEVKALLSYLQLYRKANRECYDMLMNARATALPKVETTA